MLEETELYLNLVPLFSRCKQRTPLYYHIWYPEFPEGSESISFILFFASPVPSVGPTTQQNSYTKCHHHLKQGKAKKKVSHIILIFLLKLDTCLLLVEGLIPTLSALSSLPKSWSWKHYGFLCNYKKPSFIHQQKYVTLTPITIH